MRRYQIKAIVDWDPPGHRSKAIYPLASIAIIVTSIVALALDAYPWVPAVILVLVVIAAARSAYFASGRDVFHPLVFPPLYVAFALLAPWAYVVTTGVSLSSLQPEQIPATATWVMVLTVAGWLTGSLSIKRIQLPLDRFRLTDTTVGPSNRTYQGMGSLILGIVVVAQIYLGVTRSGLAYGADQTSYDAGAAIASLSQGLLTLAVLLIVVARADTDGSVLGRGNWIALGIIAILELALLGNRGDLIGPVVIILWARNHKKRLRLTTLIILPMILAVGFVWVGDSRTDQTALDSKPFLAKTLVNFASPQIITNQVVRHVPGESPYLLGETYLATFQQALPGPVSRALNGGEIETASYRYRKLVRLDDADYGVSFSFPSESYWNFGLPGAFILSFLVGRLFVQSYNRATLHSWARPICLLYPILLGMLPYGLRSDSLTQLKLTLYPLIGLWFVALLARSHMRLRGTISSAATREPPPASDSRGASLSSNTSRRGGRRI